MSRIGRAPVKIPTGVSVTINGNKVTVQGPKGKLESEFDRNIKVEQTDGVLTVSRNSDDASIRAKHGLTRSLINNMVVGVSEGFSKTLDVSGVGYKVNVSGNKLNLNLGYSHLIDFVAPEGITIECPTAAQIKISGIDKQQVGQVASNIRSFRKVEPYHGYGIRYSNEVVVRKVGKTAGKGKK